MRKLIFVLLFFFKAFSANSQSFPAIADSPAWKVGVWSFWSGWCDAYNWRYGNSILICGSQYVEVVECDQTNSNCQVMGYIRVDSQQVFVRKTTSCTETDKLMYDFSLLPSAVYSMAYNLGSYDSTTAHINSTQNIIYQNVSRLTQFISYYIDPPANTYMDAMQLISGIGSDIHPFHPLVCLGDFCEKNLQLMEYRENNTLLYSKIPVFPLQCLGWTGIKEEENDLNISVYPNPFTDKLHIHSSNNETVKIILYDITLRKIVQKEFTGSATINVKPFSKGIYVYEMWSEGELVRKQKIVKE